jgi:hypothetical protein
VGTVVGAVVLSAGSVPAVGWVVSTFCSCSPVDAGGRMKAVDFWQPLNIITVIISNKMRPCDLRWYMMDPSVFI